MNIRNFAAGDESAIIALWNNTLTVDTVEMDLFCRRVLCDAYFDPDLFLIAEDSRQPVGFAYAVINNQQAWIGAMGVQSEYRCMGIGTALLNKLEAALIDRGAKNITLGNNPFNYFFPGVDQAAYKDALEFFKSRGYAETGDCVSMDMNLRGYRKPQKYIEKKAQLEAGGYRFQPFRIQDTMSFITFLREHFPSWQSDVCGSILGGRAQRTVRLAWDPDGKVIGFAMRSMDGTEERFGPFGVAEFAQGKSIGAILFNDLMENMVERRIFYTYFQQTTGRNLDIYGTWGMKIYRTYSLMSKDWKEPLITI